MTCTSCGATLPDDAQFCEDCGRSVTASTHVSTSTATAPAKPPATPPATPPLDPPFLPPSNLAYGAIEGRPTGRTFTFTLVGIVALALAIAGFWYYKVAEERRLTTLDHPVLGAELDALKTAHQQLQRLATLSAPETKPADFAKQLDEAKTAVERYHEQSKLGQPLPSGRQWPGQFYRSGAYVDEAIKFFPGVGAYLKQRATIPATTSGALADVDQNIVNVAGIAGEPLDKLTATLDELEQQRASVSWVYEPKPKGAPR